MSARAAEEPAETVLYQAFSLAQPERWSTATLRLDAPSWRVDSVAGPPATAAQLAGALRSLGAMIIAARCQVAQEPPTFYPCALELQLDAPRKGATGQAAIPASGWSSTSGHLLERVSAGTVAATFFPGAPGNPLDRRLGPDHVGLIAPPALVERLAMPGPRELAFRIRVVPSPLVADRAKSTTGVFVLSTRPMPARMLLKPDAGEKT